MYLVPTDFFTPLFFYHLFLSRCFHVFLKLFSFFFFRVYYLPDFCAASLFLTGRIGCKNVLFSRRFEAMRTWSRMARSTGLAENTIQRAYWSSKVNSCRVYIYDGQGRSFDEDGALKHEGIYKNGKRQDKKKKKPVRRDYAATRHEVLLPDGHRQRQKRQTLSWRGAGLPPTRWLCLETPSSCAGAAAAGAGVEVTEEEEGGLY